MLKDVFTVVNCMESEGAIERYALGGAVAATFSLEPIATIDMDCFTSILRRILAGKETLRRQLAALPLAEKLRMLELLRARSLEIAVVRDKNRGDGRPHIRIGLARTAFRSHAHLAGMPREPREREAYVPPKKP